jgi:chlorophyll synthase
MGWLRITSLGLASIMIIIHALTSLFFANNSPILYSIAGLGIAIVNDFKSIEGDRELGLNSLPLFYWRTNLCSNHHGIITSTGLLSGNFIAA